MSLLLSPLQLRVIRCAFVNKMLESSSFNKLLTGARECNRMLELAIGNKSRAGSAQRTVSVNLGLADRVKLAAISSAVAPGQLAGLLV
jgi:hypothetical protein